jgi:hypothetical protein
MSSTARLPGIQFDVVSPPASTALVRMDIAAFVGFAASGPLHQPVAVEDISHFEEIFGNDLALASDVDANQTIYACLPSAVRAFFRNGGSRCWIIRVAGEGVTSNVFAIPGLLELQPATPTQAFARARSQGSWSDVLVVGIALRSQAITAVSLSADSQTLVLSLSATGDVGPGDLLKLTFPGREDILWFFVDSIAQMASVSPPLQNQGLLIAAKATNLFWQTVSSPPAAGLLPVCERITMDMFVQDGDGGSWTLTELGFAPAHPRYWASLPDDAALYAMDSLSGLAEDAAHPRFPLAGIDANSFYLPLGAGPLPLPVNAAEPSSATPLERDGLAQFSSDLFLDSSLAETGTLDLASEAFYIQYQSSMPRPLTKIQAVCGMQNSRNLTGIHAALAIDEATIIAVPDAIQRGWFPVANTALTSPLDSSPLQHPEWWHFLECRQQQPFPRVNAPPAGQFQPCDLLVISSPTLSITPPEGGRFSLNWLPLAGATDSLEEAVDPEFATASVIYQGSSGSVTIYGRSPGDYYYRLRRQIGAVSSDYSNGVAIRIAIAGGWQANPISAYRNDVLLDVQRGLLRMCAARGDMLAVLAMPQHYREKDSFSHAAQVTASLGQDGADQAARSFGALYHPWLIGREEDDLSNLRNNPPDGAAAGIIAQRSSNRGPWISPANEPLHGVVSLLPALPPAYRQQFQDSQINLVRQEPSGFLFLCASTLSQDPDLVPINVRRLLSFLRKTVLKVGVDYVFEPNGDAFRRGVQRGFEKMMDSLFRQGAFAGRVSRDAFQVVADSSLNTQAAMENGQFIVELKFAPSLPLRFLTVRLWQTADRMFVTEGQ